MAWDSTTHGTADLELIDAETSHVLDEIKFHTFHSHIAMIMGFTQDAQQGRPSGPGTEASAKELYKQGYDVHLYEWHEQNDNFPTWTNLPEEELQTAIQDRGIEQHVMMGYSYGGGTVYDFSNEIAGKAWFDDAEFALSVYVDPVKDFSVAPGGVVTANPEDRKPAGSLAHSAYYQTLEDGADGLIDLYSAPTTKELGTALILDNEKMNQELLNEGINPGDAHTAIDSFDLVTSQYLQFIRDELDKR